MQRDCIEVTGTATECFDSARLDLRRSGCIVYDDCLQRSRLVDTLKDHIVETQLPPRYGLDGSLFRGPSGATSVIHSMLTSPALENEDTIRTVQQGAC